MPWATTRVSAWCTTKLLLFVKLRQRSTGARTSAPRYISRGIKQATWNCRNVNSTRLPTAVSLLTRGSNLRGFAQGLSAHSTKYLKYSEYLCARARTDQHLHDVECERRRNVLLYVPFISIQKHGNRGVANVTGKRMTMQPFKYRPSSDLGSRVTCSDGDDKSVLYKIATCATHNGIKWRNSSRRGVTNHENYFCNDS